MPKTTQLRKPKFYLNKEGEFVIENYNFSKPFANFFPGIAGKYGIPMWVFYVNRGQAICSFGTKDKDHAMLEFFPANRAWQMASSQGFRTFIKSLSGKTKVFYEPFHNGFADMEFKLSNRMFINSHALRIEEENLSLGLKIQVEYFNIPNDNYAGLARIVTVKNTGHTNKKIELLDGLTQIIPFGTSNLFLKKLGRTIEAWMKVDNLLNRAPFYKLDVDPTDRPEVIHIKEGNFYLGFHFKGGKPQILKPIIDPESIFGCVTDFSCPRQFIIADKFRAPEKEIDRSKTPCGFLTLDFNLPANHEKSFYSIIGNMRSVEMLNSSIKKIVSCSYLKEKKEENKKLIDGLGQDIATESSSQEFNLYAKQTYLDNILRGGYPQIFKSNNSESVFYVYSRKHGDLERDYNKFQLQPAYFSQGNGNYRDINQNRRSDIWFNPQIKDENLIYFFSLLQTDGFNPLVVKGASFTIKENTDLGKILANTVGPAALEKILPFLAKAFTPGELILFIEDNNIKLKCAYDEFLNILLSHCQKHQQAEHGEGFWSDHWTYNLDLLENYLGVYPEKLREILFEKNEFTYFDNSETVRPRNEKYMLYNGSPRQLHAVGADTGKKELISKRITQAHVVRQDYGRGEIYKTTLINKLLCLVANKLASLDPFGCGIEMEANKPNWYDALNGLPALFGSSTCETFELKRLILFIIKSINNEKVEKINLTEEVRDFLFNLNKLLEENFQDNSAGKDFAYWDKSYSLKEEYRLKTRFGLSGKEPQVSTGEILSILNNALKKIDAGLNKAGGENRNTYCSYFINEVSEFEPLNPPFIKPLKYRQKRVPLFLEGQFHALRLSGVNEARDIYSATKKSALFDKELKMYKVTASLSGMPEEIGRCTAFTPGWLENESIWLHMEYKYILEVLKKGLAEEFYADFKNVLVPFQNPARYGRSVLENSSFLVSSKFPDKKLRGNGFVARLSGSTAEFLQIWLLMNAGNEPFFLDKDGRLALRFKPALAGWLFDRQGNYSFNFLSKINVTYHNKKKKDTFGKNPAKPVKIAFLDKNGKTVELSSGTIPSPYAQQIRERLVNKIEIYLE